MGDHRHQSPGEIPVDHGAPHQSVPLTEAEWDERYASGEQIWSGQPNGALVVETRDLAPGIALDVGCGEGADAIWLAEQGWQVTALDVSEVALRRGASAAQSSGVEIEWLHAGLLEAPLRAGGYDLVSVQYPSLLRTPEQAAEHQLVGAVAPGGHLLVVHHVMDLEEARSHGFEPTDYVSPRDVAELLDHGWELSFEESRPRDVSAGAGAHHTHDVVLHARRLP
jgi:SAM-dependent methyltransferase